MKTPIVVLVLLFMSSLFLTYGALLIVSPKKFLRLHDFISRQRQNPWAPQAWRQQVDSTEYKVLGVLLIAAGVLMLSTMLLILSGRLHVYG